MEINPSLARLRILEQVDGVQMQREAAPDDELAGCPGCPYFWTCPVPHRAENVAAPEEIDLADVADQVPARAEFRPRDVDDIGWTDEWVEVDEPMDDDSADLDGARAGSVSEPSPRPHRGERRSLWSRLRRGR